MKTKISMALFVALLMCSINVSATCWDDNWEYKRPIEINSSSAVTNYQIAINVTYDSDMQNDFDDLRFTNEEENQSLDYWIESKSDGSWAYVWVEIDSIDTNNGTQAWMYYGNSGASSASNISSTAIVSEDCEDNSVSEWTKGASAILKCKATTVLAGSYSLRYDGNGGSWEHTYLSDSSIPENVRAIFWMKKAIMGIDAWHSVCDGGFENSIDLMSRSSSASYCAGKFDIWDGSNHCGSTYTANTLYRVEIYGSISNTLAEFYLDYNNTADISAGLRGSSTDLDRFELSQGAGEHGNIYIDQLAIFKSIGNRNQEPISSIGDEETANQAPNNPNPSITPATVYTNTNIVCTANYIDVDGDDGTLNFTISANGLSGNTCDYSVNNNTQKTCNLSSGNYNKTRVINCTVTATDNNSQSTTSSVTKTVQNSPPTTPTSLTPTSGTYTTSVTINCSGSTDNDSSDTVYYDIETNITGKWTTLEDNGDGNYIWDTSSYTQNNVSLRCRATDGENNSNYSPTGTINIDNTAPPINLNTSADYNTILDRVWAYIEFYSDSTLNACLVNWNGTNETANVSGTTCYFNKTDSIGNYTFRGWANDSVDNWNYTIEYWIYINATTTTTTTTTTSTTLPTGGGGGWGGGTPNVATVIKVPTCDDGIKNQGEEGIDCGGPCSPCKAPTTTTATKATTTTTIPKATTTTVKKTTITTTTTIRAPTTTIRTTTTTISTDGGVALATTAIVILAFILFAGIVVYLMRMK